MNKGDISTRESSAVVKLKKSATLLVPFQAVCWYVSFVSVRPVDASGLTPLTPCEALVLVFPPRGEEMFAMFIYVARLPINASTFLQAKSCTWLQFFELEFSH